ncbi:MAG: UDP-N-acetylmuramoyl-L-alanine--D-glutamate ligase [Planctomycetota bacterium]|nr:UDP-N-acetylmuramoyl-L-alanine--D-glutamate ligase [Planctomycetota bacterium]MEE2939088.1 UDP-N-acetylmuramoyl-L-alanine--D-glutamate ligase [Planctomycetota bacterium]
MTSSEELAGKRVVVLGLGLFGGGAGATRWVLARGADVTVTDLRGGEVLGEQVAALAAWAEARGAGGRLRFVLGRHERSDVEAADLLVVNPGIPPRAEMLEVARAAAIPRTTAISLLLDALPCAAAGVTGTNGKSSTVTFLDQALRASGRRTHLGGNIGGSLLDGAESMDAGDDVVLELSSFQLEHMAAGTRAALRVAAITNIERDHLAWHGSVDAYRIAKMRILDLLETGGTAIVPAGPLATAARELRPDVTIVDHGRGGALEVEDDGRVWLNGEQLGDLRHLTALGAFQRENAAVALAAARRLGVTAEEAASSVARFRGLPHRLEPLGVRDIGRGRMDLVDNGVSTTPESTVAALEALSGRAAATDQRFLLCGGAPKQGLGFEGLAAAAAASKWALVPFGEAAEALSRAGRDAGAEVVPVDPCPPHHEAVADALRGSLRSATGAPRPALVLLSPACASFDGYPNFQARARAFREALGENDAEGSLSQD